MNRRDFIQSTVAAGMAALVPSWLTRLMPRVIDLKPFCAAADEFRGMYDLTQPFIQTGSALGESAFFRYSTNAKICVRVRANPNERDESDTLKMPPASRLDWTHDTKRGWMPWPKQDYRLAVEANCPRCHGNGCDPVESDCPHCDGDGVLYSERGIGTLGTRCTYCLGTGKWGKRCTTCDGKGNGTFPDLQPIAHPSLDEPIYVAARFDRLIRQHLGDCDFWLDSNVGDQAQTLDGVLLRPMFFRFAGGDGLVCPVDRGMAKKRLVEAARGFLRPA